MSKKGMVGELEASGIKLLNAYLLKLHEKGE
jgi:hypothetical protein